MAHQPALVVDANILVRAVLGSRVRGVIEVCADRAFFFLPDSAYAEAAEHLEALAIQRGGDPKKALALLSSLAKLVELVGSEVYGSFEAQAQGKAGETRSRRLADPGLRTCFELSDLD